MSKSSFGLTTWDDVEVNPKFNKTLSRDLYMRLNSGSNPVRIITRPHQYLVHQYKEEGQKGFGDRIMCSSFNGACAVCELGDRAKRRWLVGIIDRKTQSYKILDMSVSVFRGIQELSRDENWGDPGRYDIDIKVNKEAGPSGYYMVVALPHRALSPADLELKNDADLDDLLRRCSPPTSEQVKQRLDSIRKKNNVRNQVVAPNFDQSTSSNTAPMPTFGDDDVIFPDATDSM
jgi:hypothetical protein